MLLKILKALSLILLCSSCASLKLNSREKIYGVTGVVSISGAIYGFTRPEAKLKNALLFGSSLGLLASLISIALFNEEEKAREMEDKLSKLEEELGLMYNGSKIKYLTGGKSYLTKKDIPKEIKPFVSYGEWHLFELEKSQPVEVWTAIGKNRLVKKNKMFELKVPKIKQD